MIYEAKAIVKGTRIAKALAWVYHKKGIKKDNVMKKYLIVAAVIIIAGSLTGIVLARNHRGAGAVKGAAVKAETFIDVRTDQEWAAGHLDGAMHFDLARLQQGELPPLPKDAAIALYCRSGHRAGQALQILQQNGFSHVRNAGAFTDLQANINK